MVVPMKMAQLVCLKSDRDKLMAALQQCGELMPVSLDGTSEVQRDSDSQLRFRQAEALLKRLKPYQEKKGFLAGRSEVSYRQFLERSQDAEALEAEITEQLESIAAKQSEIAAVSLRMRQLFPWRQLKEPVEELRPTEYTVVRTGFFPPDSLQRAREMLLEKGIPLQELGSSGEGTACLIACIRGEEGEILSALQELGFSEVAVPLESGVAAEAYDLLAKREAELQDEVEAGKIKVSELSKHSDELELLCDQYRTESLREEAPVGETLETVYLEGWVRSDRMDRLERAVKRVTNLYELSFREPEEGETPPTVTKNSRFIAQFETITDMFSRPQYGGLDPNPVMAPWYWIIFGMMMGDVGYGLAMVVLIFAFKKLMKPRGDMAKLVNVLFYSGFTTIVFGFIFGSFFGADFTVPWFPIPLPIVSPLGDPIGMLMLSLGIGVLHIFTGMIVKMYEDIRSGHVLDAIFDQLTWMFVIIGLVLLAVEPLRVVGIVMAVLGAGTILLTGGRNKKGIGKVTGGLGALYNITSFLSDILSYARIMALGLATGVIGMVMNTLAGMVMGIPLIPITENVSVFGILFALIIYIVGHVFNLAMSLLSAYVHDSRLQYIEFYNKFYDGGGIEFKPLAIQTRYVDLIQGKSENNKSGGKSS